MAVHAIPFTTSGELTDPKLGAAPEIELAGLVQAAAGTVIVHDGTDATGPVVLASNVVGTISLNVPIIIEVGVFVAVTGGATGSVLA